MKLKKEFFLILGISVFIIMLEIVTNAVTENIVKDIKNKMDEINLDLRKINEIDSKDLNYEKYRADVKEKIRNIKKDWFEGQDLLSFFSEHDELEKISKCLVLLEENNENEEYTIALEEGEEFLYWLNHIKEKDKLELKNIF